MNSCITDKNYNFYSIIVKSFIVILFIAGFGTISATEISDLSTYDNSAEGGTLVFQSIPSDASVFIDTVYAGNTPLTLKYVYPGQRFIQLKKEGYKDWTDTRYITNGQTDVLIASLTRGTGGGSLPPSPLSGRGMISIMSEPPGAHISLDGVIKGNTPTTLLDIQTGSHSIELTSSGYKPYLESVTVYSGKATMVRAFLLQEPDPVIPSPTVWPTFTLQPSISPTFTSTIPIPPTNPVHPQIQPLPGMDNPPQSIDGDSLYRDINGNYNHDYRDITLYYEQIGWIATNEPLEPFDFNRNGRIDYNDIVTLFEET